MVKHMAKNSLISLPLWLTLFLMGTTLLSPVCVKAFTLNFVEGSDIDTLDPAITRSRPTEIVTEHLFNHLVKWKDTIGNVLNLLTYDGLPLWHGLPARDEISWARCPCHSS